MQETISADMECRLIDVRNGFADLSYSELLVSGLYELHALVSVEEGYRSRMSASFEYGDIDIFYDICRLLMKFCDQEEFSKLAPDEMLYISNCLNTIVEADTLPDRAFLLDFQEYLAAVT